MQLCWFLSLILCEVDHTNILTSGHDVVVRVGLRRIERVGITGQKVATPFCQSLTWDSRRTHRSNTASTGRPLITSASRRIAYHLGYVVVVSSVLFRGIRSTLIYGAPPSQGIHM